MMSYMALTRLMMSFDIGITPISRLRQNCRSGAALRRSIAAYLETHTAAFWFFSYIGIPVLLLSGVSALACLFALPMLLFC